MKRMSSDPADWGISVFTVSREQARKLLGIPEPKPTGPPPWEITADGYMAANRNSSISDWRKVETETPIFIQACMQHNTRTNAGKPAW